MPYSQGNCSVCATEKAIKLLCTDWVTFTLDMYTATEHTYKNEAGKIDATNF